MPRTSVVGTFHITCLIILTAYLRSIESFNSKSTCVPRVPIFRSLMMVKIALTREEGGNDKLAQLLQGLDVCEIPCIMFAGGEDSAKLPGAIMAHDLIMITSPQAAKVFISAWEIAERPDNLKIATVGEGSSKPLRAVGLIPIFEPSDSTAVTLAAELPSTLGRTILYPSSTIAENTLVEGLEKRGFEVRNY